LVPVAARFFGVVLLGVDGAVALLAAGDCTNASRESLWAGLLGVEEPLNGRAVLK
jgi:hypothetical protein